jgi:Lamin Tail Domain
MPKTSVCGRRSRLDHPWIGALVAVIAMGGCAVAPAFDDPGLVPDGTDGGVTPAGGDGAGDSGAYTNSGDDDAGQGNSGPDSAPPPPPPPKDAGTGKDASLLDAAPPPPPPPPGVSKPKAGEVIISELLYDPSGTEPDNEWIELFNTTAADKLLTGLVLTDGGGRTHTIGGPQVVIPAGAYVLLARSKAAASAAKVSATAILYEYGAGLATTDGILLANGSTGGLTLADGATQIAQAPYGGWFTQTSPGGHSIELKGTTGAQAGVAAGWCLASKTWATGSDQGTPGAASDCP